MAKHLVTMDTFATAVERLDKGKTLVNDTETDGLDVWTGNQMVGISMKVKGDSESFYFPFRHGSKFGPSGNLPLEKLEPLRALYAKEDVEHVGFNYEFDQKMLRADGFKLHEKSRCVQKAAHLMNENEPSLALKKLAVKYVSPEAAKDEEIQNEYARSLGLDPKSEMWKLPASKVSDYACSDVIITDQLEDFYLPHLATWKIDGLWREVNEYAYHVLRGDCEGFKLDLPLMEQYIIEAEEHSTATERELQRLAGYPINPRSPKQLQAWLGMDSTAAEKLEPFKDRPEIQALLHHRWWYKVNSNYYLPFQNFMDEHGILHANSNLIGTETGRMSIAKPPLQAIPVMDEEDDPNDNAYKVKDVFLAGDDEEEDLLVEADYGQAELRVGAHYAQELTMAEKLTRGADLHTETAEQLGIPRPAAKRMNLSCQYGIGKRTLALRLGITEKLAGQYLDKYHGMYPGFRRLARRCEALATDRGFIRMFTGRLRHFNVEEAYTHKASSNLIQGSVAEMIRLAYTRIAKRIGSYGIVVLQVHDSLLVKTKRRFLLEVLKLIRESMEDMKWCSVPPKVDIKVGYRWGKMKKVAA